MRTHPRLSHAAAGLVLASALCGGAAMPAQAGVFLKIPDIKGESGEKGGLIAIESFSWGATRAAPGEAEITLKAAAAPKGKVSGITLKQGAAAPGAGSGVRVGQGDVKGDGRASAVLDTPLERGSLTAVVPAGTCRLGARYPTAMLAAQQGAYELKEVVVSDCAAAAAGAGRPMETISLNYEKITLRP